MSTPVPYTVRKDEPTLFTAERAEITAGVFPNEMRVRLTADKQGGTLSTTGFGSITPDNALIYAYLLEEAVKILPTLNPNCAAREDR